MKKTQKLSLEETTQEQYKEWITEYRVPQTEKIRELYEETRVKPELPEEIIQECYKKLFVSTNCCHLTGKIWERRTTDLLELTGTLPSEDITQQAYSDFIKDDEIEHKLAFVQEMTGIEPREETVQKAYEHYAGDDDVGRGKGYDLKCFTALKRLTGIKPNIPSSAVQRGYVDIAVSFYHDLNWDQQLEQLKDLTGESMTKETMDEIYECYYRRGNLSSTIHNINFFYHLTDRKPPGKIYEKAGKSKLEIKKEVPLDIQRRDEAAKYWWIK